MRAAIDAPDIRHRGIRINEAAVSSTRPIERIDPRRSTPGV